jgi:hypothetical protein
MRVIDARTGKELRLGDSVEYGAGERLTLIDIDEGLFSANAFVEWTLRDYSECRPLDELAQRRRVPPLTTVRRQIPLQVRFTHPRFFLQKVAFIPS